MISERTEIQSALIDLVKSSTFFQVKYDKTTKKPLDFLNSGEPNVLPDSIRSNEISSQFGQDKKFGRGRRLERKGWTFELHLEWSSKEVILELFERALQQCPIIPASATLSQVTLLLVSTSVEHPVMQQETTGTVAKFLINVELGRN